MHPFTMFRVCLSDCCGAITCVVVLDEDGMRKRLSL